MSLTHAQMDTVVVQNVADPVAAHTEWFKGYIVLAPECRTGIREAAIGTAQLEHQIPSNRVLGTLELHIFSDDSQHVPRFHNIAATVVDASQLIYKLVVIRNIAQVRIAL